jgi:hypothetical protein
VVGDVAGVVVVVGAAVAVGGVAVGSSLRPFAASLLRCRCSLPLASAAAPATAAAAARR